MRVKEIPEFEFPENLKQTTSGEILALEEKRPMFRNCKTFLFRHRHWGVTIIVLPLLELSWQSKPGWSKDGTLISHTEQVRIADV